LLGHIHSRTKIVVTRRVLTLNDRHETLILICFFPQMLQIYKRERQNFFMTFKMVQNKFHNLNLITLLILI
jgi:hypothetical protein